MTYKNRIVTESNRLIMNISRSELRGRFGLVMLAVFLYFLLTAQVRQFFILFIPLGRETLNTAALGAYAKYAASGLKVSSLASSYDLLTQGAFVSGLCGFLLMFFRQQSTDPVMVFSGFETPMRYIKSLEIKIVRDVLTICGLMLFIVPGVIFAIRTSQANYLLMDDHSKTGMQCIRESWQLMRGNSMKFLGLVLSYLPWLLASALPFAMLLYFSPKNHVILFLLTTACYIPLSASFAYLLTGITAFFDLMTGHLVIDRQ
ncbi:DUF975 family protein [Eubacterium sp. F2]|uniref:DUF975 family protein n=1 Tax=Eubacterium sp. F2 TaxID=3381348 RepID=UPI003907F0F0